MWLLGQNFKPVGSESQTDIQTEKVKTENHLLDHSLIITNKSSVFTFLSVCGLQVIVSAQNV